MYKTQQQICIYLFLYFLGNVQSFSALIGVHGRQQLLTMLGDVGNFRLDLVGRTSIATISFQFEVDKPSDTRVQFHCAAQRSVAISNWCCLAWPVANSVRASNTSSRDRAQSTGRRGLVDRRYRSCLVVHRLANPGRRLRGMAV